MNPRNGVGLVFMVGQILKSFSFQESGGPNRRVADVVKALKTVYLGSDIDI